MNTGSGSGVIYTKERSGVRMENPFALKVGQIFTGFGIGCGVGIGVGRPLNLGSIPVLNQVMTATRGATDAFSGMQRHVNSSLRKVGAKNIEAGIGCGIGFGHGFGAGIAVKPRVLHQIQTHLSQAATHLMEKLGISSILPLNQGILPVSLQTGTKTVEDSISNSSYEANENIRNPLEEALIPKNAAINTRHRSRTETAINNFLENPLLKENGGLLEQAEQSQLENIVLQMVLKHQLLIDELTQENKKLRKILIEELKVEPGKLQSSFMDGSKSPCSDCFECRRKQRRKR